MTFFLLYLNVNTTEEDDQLIITTMFVEQYCTLLYWDPLKKKWGEKKMGHAPLKNFNPLGNVFWDRQKKLK